MLVGRGEGIVHSAKSAERDASPLRAVTLIGAGGSGKTRLAIEIGSQLVAEFPNGVWWVDLSALQEEAFVPNQVAKALGVQEQPNVPLIETLQENLSAKQLLLVLDNCEHLTTGAARLAEALLSTCPLSILATSRARLNVPGELTYQVSTLATPQRGDAKLTPTELLAFEAVKLFAERVRSHQPTFRLNEQNAPHVVRICQQLDCIPLALELATAQIQTLSLDEIAARLSQRRELVDATRAHSRQKTLHALIDWSYDLLTPVEQVLFRRLGVFAGGWTLEQAIVVAGGYESADAQWNTTDANKELSLPVTASFVVSALLHNLVSKSLVLVENERYRFLETIREYAREKLEGVGEMDATQARHYAYFVTLAETAEPYLHRKEQIEWGDRLEAEHPNLRVALDWALTQPEANLALRLTGALHFFWLRRSHASEARDWYDSALAKSDISCSPLTLAKAFSGAGSMAWWEGAFIKASSLHAQALAHFEQVNDKIGIAFSLYNLSARTLIQGDYESVEFTAAKALSAAHEANTNWLTALVLNHWGIVSESTGNVNAASQYYEEAIAFAQLDGDSSMIGVALHNLGSLETQRGNYQRAIVLLEESLRLAQELQDTSVVVGNLAELALLYIHQGEYVAAIEASQRGAHLALEHSLREMFAQAVEWLAAALGNQDQFDRAIRLWGAARALREKIGAPLHPSYHTDYEKAVSYVREHIGEERFAELSAEGREMNTDQVRELIFL